MNEAAAILAERSFSTAWRASEPSQTREFHGMGKWSGTSFSTPLVAGLVAARMSATHESSRDAWDALFAVAQGQEVAGVGPVLRPDRELA